MFVIAYGNVFDGIVLVGPFDDDDAALKYAEEGEGDWTIVELEPVQETATAVD